VSGEDAGGDEAAGGGDAAGGGPGATGDAAGGGPGATGDETIVVPGAGSDETIVVPGAGSDETIVVPGAGSDETTGAPGATGDEAAWQDLVARYELPADPADAAPWPDRESLAPPARDQEAASHSPGAGDRARVIRPAATPPVPAPASSPGRPSEADGAAPEDAEDHYIPPPPPPLPHLDPIAKGAWTALFGGPAYLLLTSFLGWSVPGWAALLAVMAFVGGFAVVVLRLGDGPSRGSGPDNGAML
jgi:hypothetical protein